MPGILIATSKRGRIWPSEHWKPLIDSLFRKGTKKDPRESYPDLADQIAQLVEERDGRFYPRPDTPFCDLDDPALDTITIGRTSPGSEVIHMGEIEALDIEYVHEIRVPYFGTIGDSKAERQTRENREIIAEALGEIVAEQCTGRLALRFHLSRSRRDRDLDNLADAVMPCFNKLVGTLDLICLYKGAPVAGSDESVDVACPGPRMITPLD